MFDSPSALNHGQLLECDVCIAGAGAAGITLALELDGSSLDVCLVEAGEFEPPLVDDTHPYAGESVGEPYSLVATRLRYFGGTTNHWGGWCMPLDPIDFRSRPFVPLSGWPFTRSELESYYERAARICEIDPPIFELDKLPGGNRAAQHLLDYYDPDFTVKLLRYSPPTRFGLRYRSRIEQSKQVRCFLYSTVVEIEAASGSVSKLRVRAGDKQFFVKARAYVIALGAIENARLLLCSDRTHPEGLGNSSGFVGRCFADHIGNPDRQPIGYAVLPSRSPYSKQYDLDGLKVMLHLSFQDEFLWAQELVNFGIWIYKDWSTSMETDLAEGHFDDPRLYPEWRGKESGKFGVGIRLEPTPNPDSRLMLLAERDSNGMRRIGLDWRINSLELDAGRRITELLGRKLGRSGIGRFRSTYPTRPRENGFNYGSHHMGTTRMSTDPEFGVTDADCRVHFVDNLYVTGSSVFPTFGFANPTLTICALAIRLADHLKSKVVK